MRWLRHIAAGGALVLLATGWAPSSAAQADSAVTPKNSAITVTGAGWGHGKGMSQYGAYGAALSGLSYTEILAFYYPKTTVTSLKSGDSLRVWISADNDNRTTVKPATGLKITDSTGKSYQLPTGSGYTQWRISLSGSARVLHYRKASGTWVAKSTGLDKARSWSFDNPDKGTVTLILPGGASQTYRGNLTLRPHGSGARTVNTLSMENYLRSVVPSEMPGSWHAEALKAQAVAARSYAARYRDNLNGRQVYDICDTTACQAYRGTGNEYGATSAAVSATANKVLSYGGGYALTMFSSSNGGHSADGGLPYLVAKKDPYDGKVKSQAWTKALSSSTIQRAYPSIGTLKSVQVTQRDGNGSWGGRVDQVKIVGSRSSVTVTGSSFKSTFGLKERLFTLSGGTPTNTLSAVAALSANETRWKALGGAEGALGAPTGPDVVVAGGKHATYAGGDLWWSEKTGSHWLSGALLKAYLAAGGPASELGFPASDQTTISDGNYADFEVGRITCPTSGGCGVTYG
ncbi:MAG: SpoIID/LytB domain-containing protein [Propionicimonas sp.]